MELFIKDMVSLRCKMTVKREVEKLGLHCIRVDWGRIEIMEMLSMGQIQKLRTALLQSGLELMDNKKSILIERIKSAIVEMVHYSDGRMKTNFSDHLSAKLNLDYTYLANMFSGVQGITIEQFIILHKIHKVKELIGYNELNLTEISLKMHYSSVAHLSAQFKKVTGLTPSHYKQLGRTSHIALENV